jgi:hypothetical protein
LKWRKWKWKMMMAMKMVKRRAYGAVGRGSSGWSRVPSNVHWREEAGAGAGAGAGAEAGNGQVGMVDGGGRGGGMNKKGLWGEDKKMKAWEREEIKKE